MQLRNESNFCPVTCKLAELENEISVAQHLGVVATQHFLEGVRHTRIVLAAAINRAIAA